MPSALGWLHSHGREISVLLAVAVSYEGVRCKHQPVCLYFLVSVSFTSQYVRGPIIFNLY
jgi:hypothetical protein